jgi:hypothetical protein
MAQKSGDQTGKDPHEMACRASAPGLNTHLDHGADYRRAASEGKGRVRRFRPPHSHACVNCRSEKPYKGKTPENAGFREYQEVSVMNDVHKRILM